jgi:uncharacterized protein
MKARAKFLIKFALPLVLGCCTTFAAWAGAYEDFFIAIRQDDAHAVHKLLQRGLDPNTRDPQNFHGLFLALREDSQKVARLLISVPKIELNAMTADGETPLMMAVFKGQVELAVELIDKGADVNQPGWTPLHYAATAGQLQLIKILLDKYAYIDAESPNKTTPLMMAAHYGTADAVNLLLQAGADVNLKNALGMSALDFALQADRQASAKLISAFIRAKLPAGRW